MTKESPYERVIRVPPSVKAKKMLAPSRILCHQSNQYHEEDVRKRYGKSKNSGLQSRPMKN